MLRLVAIPAAAVILVANVALSVQADVKSARASMVRGDYAEAEADLRRSLDIDKPNALLGLAEICVVTGRYNDAVKYATDASLSGAPKGEALCVAGEAFQAMGKTADAIRVFTQAAAVPASGNWQPTRARVFLGITQLDAGQTAAGTKTLDTFFADFNAGKIDKNRADQLTYTAMAAVRLKVWQDASDTFGAALEKDPNFLLANVEWGDLFLAKYNAAEAAKNYQAALKINKSFPPALVGMASARLEAAYDLKGATKLADEALKTNPNYVPAINLKARIALEDEKFADAEKHIAAALAINPVDLQALTLLGAAKFLQDDTPAYETARQNVLKQNATYSDFYYVVGEMAVRAHRYEDAIRLNREAIKLDPKNANALSALGTNLLRRGLAAEPEALPLMQKAFDEDGFNVRTFNTLQLYDEVIKKDYESVPGGIFAYRFNKKESPLLRRFVPPLMQRAWDTYVKKYGFQPKNPITVELFTQRQHYGARTIGLPEFGAQGTCFGELITAMSPSSAEANWELVLWHELGHVFHLQLSKNRVARWFTEGLCEYETNVERPYWKREQALDIFQSMKRGDMWKISELSAAFTHPDRENGVILAYMQSSMVIHYLVETYGFPKIVEALKLYGAGKSDTEVMSTITGKPLATLDTEFAAWLTKKYAHYEKGFLFDADAYEDLAALKKAAEAKPSDPVALANLAAALIAKEPPAAAEAARKALAADAKNSLARFVLAMALFRTQDPAGARKELETLIANGVDGYDIRLALGNMALQANEPEKAIEHLNAAKKWDPDRTDPYTLLMKYYEAKDKRDELLKEAEAYLDVQEHDHDAARLLIDRYSLDKRWADVARVGERVIGITPMSAFVHHMVGFAYADQKKPKEAIPALEAALAGGVRKPGAVRGLLAKQYLLAGDPVKAKAAATQALKEQPNNPDATAVLSKVK